MGLDSLNKNKLSRRGLFAGAGAIAATYVLKTSNTGTASVETPVLAIPQESVTASESVAEEEVRVVLRNLLGNTSYKEARKLADGDGLYLFEVHVPDGNGYLEYSYRRGRPEKSESPGWRVDKTFYDQEGIPISGHSVAQKIGGTWNLTP